MKLKSIRSIWLRNFTLFIRTWKINIFWSLFEPLVLVFAIGYGLGAFVSNIQGVSYFDFFFPGFLCASAMTIAFFDATYGNFSKLNYQGIYSSMIRTPLRIQDIVLGEAIWSASKATVSIAIVAFIVGLFSQVQFLLLIPALLVVFLSSLFFSCLGIYAISSVKNYDSLIYFTGGFIVPMSLLCGTYFPIEELPKFLQYAVYLLPLTHAVALVRGLFLGGLQWWEYIVYLGYFLVLFVPLYRQTIIKLKSKLIS